MTTWQAAIVWLLLIVSAGIAGYAAAATIYQMWQDTNVTRWEEGWVEGWDEGQQSGLNLRTMTQNIEVGPRAHRGRCILLDEPVEEE